jgi:single-strand DNA-binding protein
MRSINVVALTGTLVADPESGPSSAGAPAVMLRVANRVRRRRGGAWGQKVSCFHVEVIGAQAEVCAERLTKGSRVAIQGEIEIDEWKDKDGVSRSRTVIRQANVGFSRDRKRDPRQADAAEPGRLHAAA